MKPETSIVRTLPAPAVTFVESNVATASWSSVWVEAASTCVLSRSIERLSASVMSCVIVPAPADTKTTLSTTYSTPSTSPPITVPPFA